MYVGNYLVLVLPFFLISCSRANEVHEFKKDTYVKQLGWETVCLGRFLIDLPGPAHMSGTKEKYQGAHGVGVEGFGAKGIGWSGVTIDETVPTTRLGYESIRDGAGARVADRERYIAGFKELEEIINFKYKETLKGTPKQIAAAKERLAESKMDMALSHYGMKVSGKAKLGDENAFAYRRGDDYSLGYLDPVDSRVRLFEGKITVLKLESPEAAGVEFRRFKKIYKRRAPTEIPRTPGFCTNFGFVDETAGPEPDTTIEVPFRSLKYPNLIFNLTIVPADANGEANIQELPRMGAEKAQLHLIGIKDRYGPVAENILGTPGRSYGHVYGPNCSSTSCRPADQEYEIEAETFGVLGSLEQPHVILHMTAATSDDYKLRLPAQPNEPSYNQPSRPGLSGKVPPPFKEGKEIFEQVLRSIRLRPGAIAAPSADRAAQSAAPAPKN